MKYVLLFLLLASCGYQRDGGTNGTSITVGARREGYSTAAVLNGQLMVYIKAENGSYSQAFSLPSELGAKTIQVPNGRYRMYGVGWEGANPGVGNTRCAESGPIDLSGAPKSIVLTYSAAACQHNTDTGPFSALSFTNGATNNFRQLGLKICSDLPPTSVDASVNSHSWRISIDGYVRDGGGFQRIPGDSIIGTCKSLSAGVGQLDARMPSGIYGEPALYFLATTIQVFSDGSCGNLVRTYSFPDGLRVNSQMPSSNFAVLNTFSTDDAYLHLKRDF